MNEIWQHPDLIDTFKMETIDITFKKIINSNAVNILKRPNEYCQKMFPKSGVKIDLYPAMEVKCATKAGT